MSPRLATVALWRAGLARLSGFGRALLVAGAANTALAVGATLPVFEVLDRELSRSRCRLAAARFDLDWFMDVEAAAAETFRAIHTPLLLAASASLLVSVFLAGGLLARLRAAGATDPTSLGARAGVRVADLLADGARYFPRFLRLFGLVAVAYAIVFWFLRIRLSERLEDAMEWWPSDAAVLGVRLLFSAAVLWILAWIHMAQDLARLAAVVHGERGMVKAFVRGLRAAARHFELLSKLYLWGLGGWGVMSGAYLLLAATVGAAPGAWGTVALFALAQLYMLGRTWIGFGLAAALVTWYEGASRG